MNQPTPGDARQELRRYLLDVGLLHSGPETPLLGRDGSQPPWILYSWNLTLTDHGARLAAGALLDLLADFEGTQLAGYGYTAMPLVSACVLLGAGRYTGLCVRTERKTYGAGRQVDGPLDPTRKVVVVDDAMSSGQAFRAARDALEEAGLEVEGGVTLVHFPYRGGRERSEAVGYKIRSVFDVWADLRMPVPPFRPGHQRAEPESWSAKRVPDGMHPAVAARVVADHYLRTGEALLPPHTLDRSEDASGGTFVSLRRVADDRRLSRQGFWHFNPAEADACRDLVLATVQMCRLGSISAEQLASGKLAVTFLPTLERCEPRDLDYDRYGIVVRSTVWPPKAGGALPNTQSYTSVIEQLAHARRNAALTNDEPHELYRYDVVKRIEPGFSWPGYGVATALLDGWVDDTSIARRLMQRGRDIRDELLADIEPVSVSLPPDLIPVRVNAVAVTFHAGGRAIGCSVSGTGDLDDKVRHAIESALADRRFGAEGETFAAADLVISVLHDAEPLGVTDVDRVARQIRPGHDSVVVSQGERTGIFLESVLPHFEWSRKRFVTELLVKAGITDPPYRWTTYKTEAWLAPMGRLEPHPLLCGFVDHRGRPPLSDADVPMLADFLAASIGDNGMPRYRLLPAAGAQETSGTLARSLHGLLALGEAAYYIGRDDYSQLATRSVAAVVRALPDDPQLAMRGLRGSYVALASLLETISSPALTGLSHHCDRISTALKRTLRSDGAIAAPDQRVHAADHDFLPGLVLHALARSALATGTDPGVDWECHLRWYRHRFRMLHPWGLATWQAQAWASVYALTEDEAAAEFTLEAADWICRGQLQSGSDRGSFLARDLYPDGPSFHTAFMAEGIVAAAEVAHRRGDRTRFDRYRDSWQAALAWTTRLVVRDDDLPLLPAGRAAVGGVRAAPASGDQRIDYTSHVVIALLGGLRIFGKV